MKTFLAVLLPLLLLILGCGKSASGGKYRASDLKLTPEQSAIAVVWGSSADVAIDVTWLKKNVRAPITLTPSEDTPSWLKVSIQPDTIPTPGRASVHLSVPPIGQAPLGHDTLVLEATAAGLEEAVPVRIAVWVERVQGAFSHLTTDTLSKACGRVCATAAGNNVFFHDLPADTSVRCGGESEILESSLIGGRAFQMGARGFGFGTSCGIAGIYSPSNHLMIINLGLSARFPRSAMLQDLVGVSDCWISPDNTVILITAQDAGALYDVLTGASLGRAVHITPPISVPVLTGTAVTSGSYSWSIQ